MWKCPEMDVYVLLCVCCCVESGEGEVDGNGNCLAGARINFNRRHSLAGFTTPCSHIWSGSGLILIDTRSS